MKRTFTQAEADAALPYLSRVVADIADTHDLIVIRRKIMERIEIGLQSGNLDDHDGEYRRLMGHLRTLVRELDNVGVDLHDFERGLISFPINGEDLMWTWMPGEDAVVYLSPTDNPAQRVKCDRSSKQPSKSVKA